MKNRVLRRHAAFAGVLAIVAASIVAGSPSAGAGSTTTTNACFSNATATYSDLPLSLTGTGAPNPATLGGGNVTVGSSSFSGSIPSTLLVAGYNLGLLTVGVNTIPATVYVARSASNATPTTQVDHFTVSASFTITDPDGTPGTGDETGTPVSVTQALPNMAVTPTGGNIAFAQAAPGSIGTVPLGAGGSNINVAGSIFLQASVAGGLIKANFDCSPGTTNIVTPPGTGGFTPATPVPFDTVTVSGADSAPVVITQPTDQTVTVGGSATFTAAASGSPTPTVQWQASTDAGANWTDITGATTTSLTVSDLQASDNGTQYRAVFTNSVASATTNPATLTVNEPPPPVAPTITTQPTDQTVTVGDSATFTAAASGTPTPTVQWQASTDAGANWTDITGATTASLTVSDLQASDDGTQYRAVFTNTAGAATTDAATLTVNAAAAGTVTGTATYASTCSGRLGTVDLPPAHLTFKITGTAPDQVDAGAQVTLSAQSWEVTVPGATLQLGAALGLGDGSVITGTATPAVFGSNTAEGTATQQPDPSLPASIGPIHVVDGVFQDATTTLSPGDMTWTAVGNDVAGQGDVAYSMATTTVTLSSLVVAGNSPVLTCTPDDPSTPIVITRVIGSTGIPPAGRTNPPPATTVQAATTAATTEGTLPATGPRNLVFELIIAMVLLDLGYLLWSASRPPRRRRVT